MKPSVIVYSLGSFLAAYIILLIVYTQYPIVYGIDGPYYLIQLKHLASEGVIKYPDPPLTYYLLLPFYLLSADKNLGLKTAIAFYGGLTSLLLYMSFRRIGNFSGLTAALTFVISPYTLRLANDFFKNYVSLLFIAAFLYVIVNEKSCRKAAIYSSVMAVAAALSHVLTYGVLALLALLVFIFSFFIRSKGLRTLRCGVVGAAITSFLILAIALSMAPEIVGYDTVKLLSFLEQPFRSGSASTLIRIDFLASFMIGLAGLIYGVLKRSKLSALTMGSGALLILLNLPILEGSWLFRFGLMSSILIPPITATIIGEVEEKTKPTAFLLVIGLMIMITLPVTHALRPSISMNEYFELQKIPENTPSGSKLLIPNVRLRYWVEALHGENYEILDKPPIPPSQIQDLYLIVEKNKLPRGIPPRAKLIFDGRNIMIIELG